MWPGRSPPTVMARIRRPVFADVGAARGDRVDGRLHLRDLPDDRASGAGNMAPVAIGLTLTLLHIMSIPIDNTSLNPARSTATVLFAAESWPLAQLLAWVAPIIGGVLGGLVHKSLGDQALSLASSGNVDPQGHLPRRPSALHLRAPGPGGELAKIHRVTPGPFLKENAVPSEASPSVARAPPDASCCTPRSAFATSSVAPRLGRDP